MKNLEDKTVEQNLEIIKKHAYDSWPGKTGEARADDVEKFIKETIKNYSDILGFSEKDILNRLEWKRDYSVCNYYQTANFPLIQGDVALFKDKQEFFDKFPSKKFICPNCSGISTDRNDCNSGKRVKNKICDWKSYGLFGTLGKGYQFVVKDNFLENPVVYNIFKPIEL